MRNYLLGLWLLAAPLLGTAGPFAWFQPASFLIIGGKESVAPTAPPEILRTQCVEAALEMNKSFPGRQQAIGLFWSPPGNRLEDLPEHLAALKQGLREAVEILGAPEQLVFIGWVVSDEILSEIERDVGIRTGTFGFEYWRWHATYSRKMAEAGVELQLNEGVLSEPGDVVAARLERLGQANRVTFDLVSHEGVSFGEQRLYNAAGEAVWENFTAEPVIQRWENATAKSAEVFRDAPAFVGVMLDEPILYLNDHGVPLHSPELKALYAARYGTPMPEFPREVAARRGADFVRLDEFYRNLLNPFVRRCVDALKRGNPDALAITPLVSVEYPWTGFDYLDSPLDVISCDPYAYADFQVVHTQVEQQLYDDAAGILGSGVVHILSPRRAVWKLMGENSWQWEYGELVSWTRSFRRLTPLVNHITDEVAMRDLEKLSGILVWPIARVTTAAETARLRDWVAQGNVLVLSRATSFDAEFAPVPPELDPLLDTWISGVGAELSSGAAPTRVEWDPLRGDWAPETNAPLGDAGMLLAADGTALPLLMPLRALRIAGSDVELLATLPDGQPVAAAHRLGSGLVIVALGAEAAPDYPTNIAIDNLLIRVAERALDWRGVPAAGKLDDPEQMLFFNTDGRFLTVFVSGAETARQVWLRDDPQAFGVAHLAPTLADGTPLSAAPDGWTLPFGVGERLKLIRLY